MDISVIGKGVATFEFIFQISRPAIRKLAPLICTKEALADGKSLKKIVALGPSYLVSFLMSWVVTTRGWIAVQGFAGSGEAARMVMAGASLTATEQELWDAVLFTNHIFLRRAVPADSKSPRRTRALDF